MLVGSLPAWSASWSLQTTTNPPGPNGYGAARYDRWQQQLIGWWRSSQTPSVIYSDALLTYDAPLLSGPSGTLTANPMQALDALLSLPI
jgi:hypothetical protein